MTIGHGAGYKDKRLGIESTGKMENNYGGDEGSQRTLEWAKKDLNPGLKLYLILLQVSYRILVRYSLSSNTSDLLTQTHLH
jgi:hypothetical protein